MFVILFRTSSRPEAVKVIPVAGDDRCSRTAVVTSIGTSSHKTSAIVLAQEISWLQFENSLQYLFPNLANILNI